MRICKANYGYGNVGAQHFSLLSHDFFMLKKQDIEGHVERKKYVCNKTLMIIWYWKEDNQIEAIRL